MDKALNATVTRLVVSALDAAGVGDRQWCAQFKISAARLARIRVGHAALTDVELGRISRVTGQPWQDLVLGLIGKDNRLTAETRELVSRLHSVSQSAAAEAANRRKREFGALSDLLRKKSA